MGAASCMGEAAGHGDGIIQSVVCLVAVQTAIKEFYGMIFGTDSLKIEEGHLRGSAVYYPYPVLGGTLRARFADHLDPRLVTVAVTTFQICLNILVR